MEEQKSKLEALTAHLAQGAQQAKEGDFIEGFSMEALIKDQDSKAWGRRIKLRQHRKTLKYRSLY